METRVVSINGKKGQDAGYVQSAIIALINGFNIEKKDITFLSPNNQDLAFQISEDRAYSLVWFINNVTTLEAKVL